MSQVDRINGLIGTLGVKAPCRVATTADITLSGLQTVDGVAVVAEDRVLVQNQTSSADNGIWVVQVRAWERAPDFDGPKDVVSGTMIPISEGATNGGSLIRVSTTGAITVGSTSLAFATVSTPADLVAAQAAAAAAQAAQAAAQAAEAGATAIAKIQWRGAWDSGTAYSLYDAVSRNGSSYICTTAHTNQAPPSASYWDVLAQQGSNGAGTGDMLAANNLSDVVNAATARTNLGAMPAANDTVTFAQINSAAKASQAQAQAGSDNATLMTPLRVAQALSALGGVYQSGTRMVFNQTTPPTGWTKDTTAALNDSIMRIVTGTVGSGGSVALSTWNAANPSVGATTLSISQIPSHTHTAGSGNTNTGSATISGPTTRMYDSIGLDTGAQGGGGSHTHTGIGAPSLKYNDFIIASKD